MLKGEPTRRSVGIDPNHFGRLLRFWRSCFEFSQEQMAHSVDISTRHLSFLETGKAQPSRTLVDRIISQLGLGRRDAGNLLGAAGFMPSMQAADLSDPGNEYLRLSVVVTLRCFDPFPAAVIDPFANIKMVNRAWVHAHRRLLGEAVMGSDLNSIRLLVVEDGWRKYMVDWAQVACLYLVILQQEAILRDSTEAQALLDEIVAVEGIPVDWARRGASSTFAGDHHRTQGGTDGQRRYVNVHHTVGSTPFVSEPRLILHGILPENGIPEISLEALHARLDLAHPLCPY